MGARQIAAHTRSHPRVSVKTRTRARLKAQGSTVQGRLDRSLGNDDEGRRIAAWAYALWDEGRGAGRQRCTGDSGVGVRSMRTWILRRNHDYEDGGLAIGRCIFIGNEDKGKGKETKVRCCGRPKDEDRRTRKQIQRLRKEERKAEESRGAHPTY